MKLGKFERIFNAVCAHERYRQNLDWGKPRAGHPEGTVRAHVAELEQNLEALRAKLSDEDCWKLRVLIHTHDTFKGEAKAATAITHPQSHASLARRFLSGFCDDADLLAMVQFHDEPYALWRQVDARGRCNPERFAALLAGIRDWNLFLAFCIIDGCTQGKSREPLCWFLEEVKGKVEAGVGVGDVLW